MLPLMLMLVADPLTPPPAQPAPSVRMIDAEATMRVVNQTVDAAQRLCHNGQIQRAAAQRSVRPATSDLMFRQGDPVRMTLLLERQVGGCSLPISYDLTTPDSRLPSFPARAD